MSSSKLIKLYNILSKEEDHADPPVTARQAKKCINLLQQFFMQENNKNIVPDKLEAYAHFFNQIHTKQPRQKAITTFCTPSTTK